MSPRLIVTDRKMILPPYPPGSYVYGVKDGTTNSIDNMRTFLALYLRPNDEGGGHFVYNIHTMQRRSACRIIGIKKKPVPMDDNVIKTINKQASEALFGVEFAGINIETTVNDYEERDNDSDSDFEDDDKSYETSDDSTLAGDSNLSEGPNQLEEDQQQHFIVSEVNDIDENDSDDGDEGVEEEGGGQNDPVQENKETVHEIEDETGSEADDDSVHKSVQTDNPSIESVETIDDEEEQQSRIYDKLIHKQRPAPEDPSPPRPPAVRKLDSKLDGKHQGDSMVGSVIHEHCIGSAIKEYTNLGATLSTPYGFQKGMKVFKKSGHKATVKELDNNLIDRNVISMLPARSITHDMMKMSLAYLISLKRKRSGQVKGRGYADGRPQRE